MSNTTLESSAPVLERSDRIEPAGVSNQPLDVAPVVQVSSRMATVRSYSSDSFAPRGSAEGNIDGRGEFDYKPVPVIAPVALFLGIGSVIGLFGLIGLAIAVAGIILGLVAALRIRRSAGELSGQWLAVTGLGLSTFFLVAGSTLHSVAYATEVPEGFERVNFTRDISKKGFVIEDGAATIHPDVRALDDKPVFLKGYMYPERQTEGITRFVFVKDNGQCCFGGQPQLTDMILVEMEKGKSVEYVPYLVAVAGTFHARAPGTAGGLNTVYKLDASHFSPAKTSF